MIRIKQVVLLFSYLATLLAVAPVFFYLDLPVQVVIPLALVSGIWADRRDQVLLKALPATILAILAFIVYLLQLSLNNPVLPVINLLVLLLALRMVSDKASRNILQIFVLSLFTLASSSLLTLSMAYLGYLLLLALVLTVGLVMLSYYKADSGMLLNRREFNTILFWSCLLPAGSLLLMLVFFAILPRTNYPLWNFLNQTSTAKTGFTEQVKPGSFAALAADTATAFRAEMEPQSQQQLYWRGTVLNQISGHSWERSTPVPEDRVELDRKQLVTQLLFLEPRQDRFLPALDFSLDVSGYRHTRQGDFVHYARRSLQKRTRYHAEARPGSQLKLRDPATATTYLQQPTRVAPRLQETAESIRAQGTNRAERLRLLEEFFVKQQLTYASSGLQPSSNPVETFLFESRRGYCEYFASSFGLLARLSGIPARLVGGYLGGGYNQVGGYYLVTEEMAHVWVEVLDDDNFWQRIDPSRLAINAETGLLALRQRQNPWLNGLVDSLNHAWNRTVISYDLQQHFEALYKVRKTLQTLRRSPMEFKPLLISLVALILGCGMGYLLLRQRQRNQAQSLAERFLHLAASLSPEEPPEPSLGLKQAALIIRHPLADQFASMYGGIIYRDRVLNQEDKQELLRLLNQLERTLKNEQPAEQ